MTLIADPKLMPCPFCGEGRKLHVDDTVGSLSIGNTYAYAVVCDNKRCESCGPTSKTRVGSVRKWNKRESQ